VVSTEDEVAEEEQAPAAIAPEVKQEQGTATDAATAPQGQAGSADGVKAEAQQSDSKAVVASTATAQKQQGFGNVVHIVDMTWYTTDIEVEAACTPFGTVKNIKFFEDRSNGRSAGTCIVEFSSHEEAQACIEGLHKHKVGESEVQVTWPGKIKAPNLKGRCSPRPTVHTSMCSTTGLLIVAVHDSWCGAWLHAAGNRPGGDMQGV
jgi:RNA recognition motif-containing protein